VKKPVPVHCLLDCLASVLREDGRFDSRPLYLGVWEAYFESNASGISYYSDQADPKDWLTRFHQIYGAAVHNWHHYPSGKAANLKRLGEIMENTVPQRFTLVMADLYFIPHARQFRSRHIPHYFIVRGRTGQRWHIRDPYLDWEGDLSDSAMSEAYERGFTVDMRSAHPPDDSFIRQFFDVGTGPSPSRLITELRNYVVRTIEKNDGAAPGSLFASVQDAGVIAKRLWGYSLVLHYFAEGGGYDPNVGSCAAGELAKEWERLLLMVARYDIARGQVDLGPFLQRADRIDEWERVVKGELIQAYEHWRKVPRTKVKETP